MFLNIWDPFFAPQAANLSPFGGAWIVADISFFVIRHKANRQKRVKESGLTNAHQPEYFACQDRKQMHHPEPFSSLASGELEKTRK